MDDNKKHSGNLDLQGGRLCLDFVNTVDWRGRAQPQEFLNTFQDLISWSQHVGILTEHDGQKLLYKAATSPSEAESVLNRAVTLRETLYRIFSSIIQDNDPAKKDLAIFNENLSKTMGHSRIVKADTGFSWDSSGDKETLDWMLNPIIRSAADVLVSDELKRLKKCADPACGWLFWDNSRNQSKRWCAMKDCGNRAKARRFYKRKKRAVSS